MKVRLSLVVCCLFVPLLTISLLEAIPNTVGFAGRRATSVEGQHFDKKLWAQSQTNFLMNKTFPLEQWDKHFSSLGSKRAPISLTENKDKQLFKTRMLKQKMVRFEMSQWNEKLSDLHKKAGIEMDDKARLIADQKLYFMMLQDSKKYSEMADEVSLRELNRYQFRRNRSDSNIPIEKAGSSR